MGLNFIRSLGFRTQMTLYFFTFHFALLLLLNNVTAFTPDEINYSKLFESLYSSNFSLNSYLGWSDGSTFLLRILYFPAWVMSSIGLSDLLSIRILGLGFTFATLWMLIKNCAPVKIFNLETRYLVVFSFYIPSYFLWTSSGMREPFIFFFLVFTFIKVKCYVDEPNMRNFTYVFIGAIGLLLSKNYLYVNLVASILLAFAIFGLLRRSFARKSLSVFVPLLIPLLLFPSLTLSIKSSYINVATTKLSSFFEEQELPAVGTEELPTVGTEELPKVELVAARGQTIHEFMDQVDSNSLTTWILRTSGLIDVLESQSEKSYLVKGSEQVAENIAQLTLQPATLRDPLSILKRIAQFLFVPSPFTDNGSLFLNAASYESIFWYLHYFVLIFILVRYKFSQNTRSFLTLTLIVFVCIFILQSALTESNVGTSFRHRTVILTSVLLLISNMSETLIIKRVLNKKHQADRTL